MMKKLNLILIAMMLAAACSHNPKKPGGQSFPINPTYQVGN